MSTKKALTLEAIEKFLRNDGWTVMSEGRNFKKYRAPQSLGLKDEYLLNVPTKDYGEESAEILLKTSRAIASIYGMSSTQQLRLSQEATTFSARLISKDAESGSINLSSFTKIMSHVSQFLFKFAAYKSTKEHQWDAPPPSAMLYLDNCRFMQTQTGSFVANMELPNSLILTSADLFSDPVTSQEVTGELEKLIELIIRRAMLGDVSLYDVESVSKSKAFLALQAAEEFEDLLKISRQDEIVFSFTSEEKLASYSTGKLTSEKLENLETYLDFLRDTLIGEEELTLTGYVFFLKSKDPSKDRNSIQINILSGATPYSEASFSLESEVYDRAIDAHHHNRIVQVTGVFKRLKKSLKCVTLKEFKVLS